jgi:DNA-binding transcriptional regulator GbsR (MarR family)
MAISLEIIKKTFIKFMEEIQSRLFFPKNFFACTMAVVAEHDLITQDRIMELTGCSRSTVSQMLRQIQMAIPDFREVKLQEERKKFIEYRGSTKELMVNLLKRHQATFRSKTDFIPSLMKEVSQYSKDHKMFEHFEHFLDRFHKTSVILNQVIDDSQGLLENLFYQGSNKDLQKEVELLSSPEMVEFLKKIMLPVKSPRDYPIMEPHLKDMYDLYKRKFSFHLGDIILVKSRAEITTAIIFLDLLIESRPISQEEIQESTKFQRSVISDSMRYYVDQGIVEICKKEGVRKKYYRVILPWNTLIMDKFKKSMDYVLKIKDQLIESQHQVDAIENFDQNQVAKDLKEFFQEMWESIDIWGTYLQILQSRFFRRLRKQLILSPQKSANEISNS